MVVTTRRSSGVELSISSRRAALLEMEIEILKRASAFFARPPD
ncbi:hypothetical protein OR221_1899 [Microbacterium laevaniformans OR221]|nr:hypothetical protein OR221_1899 [Microbacterium laevaniformans OR221]